MKIDGISGTYYAQSFIVVDGALRLCGCFHSRFIDAQNVHSETVLWPIEMDNGIAYLPGAEEMEEFDDA